MSLTVRHRPWQGITRVSLTVQHRPWQGITYLANRAAQSLAGHRNHVANSSAQTLAGQAVHAARLRIRVLAQSAQVLCLGPWWRRAQPSLPPQGAADRAHVRSPPFGGMAGTLRRRQGTLRGPRCERPLPSSSSTARWLKPFKSCKRFRIRGPCDGSNAWLAYDRMRGNAWKLFSRVVA